MENEFWEAIDKIKSGYISDFTKIVILLMQSEYFNNNSSPTELS